MTGQRGEGTVTISPQCSRGVSQSSQCPGGSEASVTAQRGQVRTRPGPTSACVPHQPGALVLGRAVPVPGREGQTQHIWAPLCFLLSFLPGISSFLSLLGSAVRMDAGSAGLLVTLLLLLLSVLWFLVWRTDTKRSRLPPGPAPWPILGNLWQKDVLPLYRHYEKVRDKWQYWTHSQLQLDRQRECPVPK